jgi:hypothetical protein
MISWQRLRCHPDVRAEWRHPLPGSGVGATGGALRGRGPVIDQSSLSLDHQSLVIGDQLT